MTLSAWGVTARDFFDILLVAAVLYLLLRFVRSSGGFQVLKGLIPIALLALVAVWFDLRTLIWIMERLLPVLAIGAIILFQPEIRRGLARLGERAFGWRSEGEEGRVIEEIVEAVLALSSRSHGALIAVSREVSLDPFAETGTRLDAELTAELIETIFHPRTPLHDGALIVEGSRARAAGCILPLAHDEVLERQYGTRHRAAIGISRETDAVVVVVSEETGQVSLAVGGQLVRNVDATTLREMLMLYAGGGKAA